MTKIIAIPINMYKGQERPALHFKSYAECAKELDFPVERIYEAVKDGMPIKGYYIDEEIGQ